MMDINLNTIKNDGEKHLYDKNNLYFESNNVRYYNIIQMNCIYNYCVFHLRSKVINNFFSKTIFKLMKKVYTFEKIEHQIFITKTTMYRTFILSSEYPSIYIKKELY